MTETPGLLPEAVVSELRAMAAKHGVRALRVFGSTVRSSQTSGSDLDLLVDMEPGSSLLDLVAFQQDVEESLGCRVDVVSERGLSPYLRDRILREARPV